MKTAEALVLLTLALLVAACGKPTAPSNSEVLNFLNSQVPAGNPVQFTSVECDNYPQGDGQCKVKIKVTARCQADLYRVIDSATALKTTGWDESAYQTARRDVSALDEPYKSDLAGKVPDSALKGIVIGQVATKSGNECTIYGTLDATRQVDKWSFAIEELQDTAASFPGHTAESFHPTRLVAIDSDEAKQLVTQESKQEQDFVTAVKAAQDQMAAAHAAQAKADADKKAAYVKALLDSTAPGKSYLGTIVADNGESALIKLTFTDQEQGGQILKAQFSNPDDPAQIKGYTGSIAFDATTDPNPIQFTFDKVKFVKSSKNGLMWLWLGDGFYIPVNNFKLHLNSDGSLAGVGFQAKFDFKPADTASAQSPATSAVAPPAP